jgi:C4-dicarboxylate-specific signal transduction histidine kinase
VDHAKELIDKAQQQTLRAASVIRNLKDMVEKRDSLRVAENIETAIKDSLALVLFGAMDENIRVNLDLDSTVPPVLIDRVQIQQILINLIRNSVEAMLHLDERTLTLTTRLGDPGFAEVTVRDTGIGLPPDVSDRLFQPFNTTKCSGMGLGLMICQTLVEANGGRIWRLDDMPTGAGFRFCVPLAPSVPANTRSTVLATA